MNILEGTTLVNRVPWINLAVGILTLISPWSLHAASYGAKWDVTITGIVIAIVAIIAMSLREKHYWPVLNILLGVWLIVSIAFVENDSALAWSNVALGVMAIVTGLVSQTYSATSRDTRIRA
jgi:membrane-bound ClpP family serine protease